MYKVKKWSKKEIESYAKKILGWKNVYAYYYPYKKSGVEAMADPPAATIIYCKKNMDICTIWHECGHLAENLFQTRLRPLMKREYLSYWKDNYTKEEFSENVWHDPMYLFREAKAQAKAYTLAMRKGYSGIAKYLSEEYSDWPSFKEVFNKLVEGKKLSYKDVEAILKKHNIEPLYYYAYGAKKKSS